MMKKFSKQILTLLLVFLLMLTMVPSTGIFAKAQNDYAAGDIIEFGSYPQSKVTDAGELAQLDAAEKNWVSYGYYSGTRELDDGQMTPSDYILYADLNLNGEAYRAVTFSQERPYISGGILGDDNGFQGINGYSVNQIYYFKYEPLRWRILDPDTGLVLSEKAIDSQPFTNYMLCVDDVCYSDAQMTHYANDYANSFIRQWLNDDFLNTAFSPAEQNRIVSKSLDNRDYAPAYHQYDSENTTDQVFLLSYAEAQKEEYGFLPSTSFSDMRVMKGSDYAKCQGLNQDYTGCLWWLRTPGVVSNYICYVYIDGSISNFLGITDTSHGICPALKLNLRDRALSYYTVTFRLPDGTVIDTQSVPEYESALEPDAPDIPDMLFAYWDKPFDRVTADMTVTAHYVYDNGYAAGDIIEFGSYPQTVITEADTIAALDAQSKQWNNRFADFEYGGEKYRAAEVIDGVKYFRYEPIKWRILDPVEGLLLSETIIDSKLFNNSAVQLISSYYGDSTRTYYANNYERSTIRQWLNNDFLNMAFSPAEQSSLRSKTVTNRMIDIHNTECNSGDTTDPVFLLGYDDIIDGKYGFVDRTTLIADGSDYAKQNGLREYTEYSYWWLRTPDGRTNIVYCINYHGQFNRATPVTCTGIGVRPVIKLDLVSEPEDETLTLQNSATGVTLTYPRNAYEGEVELVVEQVSQGTAFELVNQNSGQNMLFNITTTLNGNAVQPNGNVTVSIPLPEGFDPDLCAIYYVNTETGVMERLASRCEDGYIIFETDHFSFYAIVVESTLPELILPEGSEMYLDETRGFIYGIPAGMRIDDFEALFNVSHDGYVEVAAVGRFVGTGSVLIVRDSHGEAVKEYTTVIFGDLDGNGRVTSTDVAFATQALVDGFESEAFEIAANIIKASKRDRFNSQDIVALMLAITDEPIDQAAMAQLYEYNGW